MTPAAQLPQKIAMSPLSELGGIVGHDSCMLYARSGSNSAVRRLPAGRPAGPASQPANQSMAMAMAMAGPLLRWARSGWLVAGWLDGWE